MSLDDEITKLEKQLKSFTIAGASGSFEHGFIVDGGTRARGVGGSTETPPPPPPTTFNDHFNVTGVTNCCMNSGGFSYDVAGVFDGDFGGNPETAPGEWFFSGPTTGSQYSGADCDPDNFIGSFDIDTHFELSFLGDLWTFEWYFIIDGSHFPIFSATSTTMDFTNTIGGCGGGSNGAFGGSVTSFSFS